MSRLLRAAGAISVLTLGSRILGLVRDILMTRALGAGWVQGTFLLAWTLPNLLRRLLGDGALSASFVPAYTVARIGGDPAAAGALLARVAGALIAILGPLCLLVAAASPFLPAELLPAPADGGLPAVRLLLLLNAILFLYALPVCLTALLAGACNAHGVFALPAAVPMVLNAFWIAALLLAPLCGISLDTHVAVFAAVALTLGGFAQLLLVAVPLWRRGALPRPLPGLPRRGSPAFGVFAAMGPTVVGMSLSQISSLLDQLMAYYLVAPGAITYIYLANRLLLFPHALTALSLAVAVFPRLAAEATAADRGVLRRTLDRAAAATILVTLPAACGLVVLADDVVRVLFESRRFLPADVGPTALTTSLLVLGLPAVGLAQLLARAFYAVGDSATPARVAGWLVLGNALLNLLLLGTTHLGTAALALSSSLSSLANAVCLARLFRRHAPPARGTLLPAFARSAVATAAMCAALPFLRFAPPGQVRLLRALGNVAAPIAAGIGIYVLALWLLRSPELALLRRRGR